MLKIIRKGIHIKICKGLSSQEFECQCKNEFCKATIIQDRLIKAYNVFRGAVDVPLKINSGFRCAAHNFAVGGTSLSRHQTGEAIDVSLKTLAHLSNEDIELLALGSGFTFIKFYKSFVHLDVRNKRKKDD